MQHFTHFSFGNIRTLCNLYGFQQFLFYASAMLLAHLLRVLLRDIRAASLHRLDKAIPF